MVVQNGTLILALALAMGAAAGKGCCRTTVAVTGCCRTTVAVTMALAVAVARTATAAVTVTMTMTMSGAVAVCLGDFAASTRTPAPSPAHSLRPLADNGRPISSLRELRSLFEYGACGSRAVRRHRG